MTVECYAGAVYPERPHAFTWQGQRYVVTRVRRQWRERPAIPSAEGDNAPAEMMVFAVDAQGGKEGGRARFHLQYTPATETWEIRKL